MLSYATVCYAYNCGVVVQSLMSELSIWRCTDELKQYCYKIWEKEKQLDPGAIEEERKRRNYRGYWTPLPPTEPFRCVLAQVTPPNTATPSPRLLLLTDYGI